MKILVAGDWHSELHEEAVYQAFQQLGHQSVRFSWHQYFKQLGMLGRLAVPLLKAQNKYMFGPVVDRLNRDLIDRAANERPDMVFIYRGSHVYPATLRELRRVAPNAILVGYNNDDPFSPRYPRWKWRHFLAGVPEYDLMLAYRLHNIEEFKSAGAKRVELLRSWFIPDASVQVGSSDRTRNNYVVYIGHHENDGRAEIISELIARNIDVKLYGPYSGLGDQGWKEAFRKYPNLRKIPRPRWLGRSEYNAVLNDSNIGLCFLSKLNRDTYTRRCFEIPSIGCALFSEYSEDLASLFQEGKEAEFFRTKDELIEKLRYYKDHPSLLDKIRVSGQQAVYNGGHDVVSRMCQVINMFQAEKSI